MAEKFIKLSNGELAENEALSSSSGAADAGKIPALDGAGLLDQSMMPVGLGPDTQSMVASENLSAGDFVNVWNDTGTSKVRKADASNDYRVHGFVIDAVISGQNALVYFEGKNTSVTGRTPGAEQYLSATAGEATETPVTTTGYISQRIGIATGATTISFEPQRPITLA